MRGEKIIVEEKDKVTIYDATTYNWKFTDKGVAIYRRSDGQIVHEIPIIGVGIGRKNVLFKTYLDLEESNN